MSLNFDYPEINTLTAEHAAKRRADSAALLIWYLQHYYRLDPLEATDHVCDKGGDKSIDGIFVNDNDETVTVFQARIRQNNRPMGDADLKTFAGAMSQFQSSEALQLLMESAGDAAIVSLIKRLDLLAKIDEYELCGEFVTNVDGDSNAEAFLRLNKTIQLIGRAWLSEHYISDEREKPIHAQVTFNLSAPPTEYTSGTNKAIIAPIRAIDLIKMSGISDQSLFHFNVRGPLGKTAVNKAIARTIRKPETHGSFPLFHNGVTVIAGELELSPDKTQLTANDYFVVNGCQSLTALFQNKDCLTEKLTILVKLIQADPKSEFAATITKNSNNQNGVSARDFMANNKNQIRLQNEFKKYYMGEYFYSIKQGETPDPGVVIRNDRAGLLLMAFDLKQPWATHRTYQAFTEQYRDVFTRTVSADRILLCHLIDDCIVKALPTLKNDAFAKFVITRYFLVYAIGEMLDKDELGPDIRRRPDVYVRTLSARQVFADCISKMVADLVIDLNDELSNLGEDFDFRDKLRDDKWVKEKSGKLVATYQKLINHKRINPFKQEWKQGIAMTAPGGA